MAKDQNNNVVYPGAPSVGLRNVGSYQVSGIPWATGSNNLDNGRVHMIAFPNVTKKVTVMNTTPGEQVRGRAILVHFQSGSADTITDPGADGAKVINAGGDVINGFHYIPVLASGSLEMNIKCTKLYISNLNAASENNYAYQVYAELTNIPTHRMPHLTGSGITDVHMP